MIIFGLDDNGLIKPIRLDASRNIQVNFDTASNPLKVYGEEAARQVKTTVYGKTVAGVKQSSLPFGYYDGIGLSYAFNSLAAGTNSVNLYIGAADEVGVLTNLVFSLSATRAGTRMFFVYNDGVARHTIYLQSGATAGVYYDRQGNWVIPPGKILAAYVIGATAGDAAYFTATGYKFKV